MTADETRPDAQQWFAQQQQGAIEDEVRAALKQVIDPEMGINIVDLGLVYETRVSPDGTAAVVMTLTSPACPLGPVIEEQVKQALHGLYGISAVQVRLVWSPAWKPEMMSEDARLELGYW